MRLFRHLTTTSSSPPSNAGILPGGLPFLRLALACRQLLLHASLMSVMFLLSGPARAAVVNVDGVLSVTGKETLSATYDLPVRIEKDAGVLLAGAVFNNLLTVMEGASAEIAHNSSITVNAGLINRGTMSFPSRDRSSVVDGKGSIENAGVINIYPVGGGGAEAHFKVAVTISFPGRLLLSSGWANFASGSSLNVAGAVELAGDGRLRFDSSLPAHNMTVQKGAQMTGTGTLLVGGENQVVMAGDATAAFHVTLVESARTAGKATLTLAGGQGLTGTYDSPVRIAEGASATMFGAIFNNTLTVAAGGAIDVAHNNSVTINGKLLNHGKMSLPSRDRYSHVNGSGTVENSGLIVVYPVGGGGAEAHFHLPVTVPVSGTLLLDAGYANFAPGSALDVTGTVDVENGRRLRFEGGEPREMIVRLGAQLLGT